MPHKPDTPCSKCGKLLWSGRTSRPAELRTCRECQRTSPTYYLRLKPRHSAPRLKACAMCGAHFWSTYGHKYCGDACRAVRRGQKERARQRQRERATKHARGYGSSWQKLRTQVLAEETHCGFCGEWVDKTLKAPRALAASVDHIIRKEDGGTDLRENLRLAHFGCNAAGRPRPSARRVMARCDMCGASYARNHDRQRTCGRRCGVALQRLNAA